MDTSQVMVNDPMARRAALNVYGIAVALIGTARAFTAFPSPGKARYVFLSDGNYPRWVLLKLNNFAASSLARRLLIALLQ